MAFDVSAVATDPGARRDFLAALYSTGSVAGAIRQTGFARATIYRQRRRDPAFAAAWDAVVGSPRATALEAAMIARATFGVERRRRYADGSEETWRVYDEVAAWRLLQKLLPGRYDPTAAAAIATLANAAAPPRPVMTRAEALARIAARPLVPPRDEDDDPPA